MGLFDDNITSRPFDELFKISYKAAAIAVRKCRRYWYLSLAYDTDWVEREVYSQLVEETDDWISWWDGGALEGTVAHIHIKKLPYWRLKILVGMPIFHIIIKAKISDQECMIRVLDKDM